MSFGDEVDDFTEELRKAGNEFRHGMRNLRDEFRGILHEARDEFRGAVDDVVPPRSDGGKLIRELRKIGDRNEEMFVNLQDAYMNPFYDTRDAQQKTHFDLADHLFIRKELYTHHAIYIGRNQVIHYNFDVTNWISIQCASLSEFAEGYKIYCMSEQESPLKYSRREAVRRAEGRLNERRYSLIANNCEHFVRWCRSGGAEWVWE